MLKSDLETKVWTIPMPIDKTYKFISSNGKSIDIETVIMAGITEKQYHDIKHGIPIHLDFIKSEFTVLPDNVFCYGKIDFHEGSEDCKTLDTFKWFDNLGTKGVSIPAKYNYDKHECTSRINRYCTTETFRISKVCRYLHGCLGKPEFTIIFKII